MLWSQRSINQWDVGRYQDGNRFGVQNCEQAIALRTGPSCGFGAGMITSLAAEWLVLGVQHTLARYYSEYITSRQSTRRGLYIRWIVRSMDHHAI